MSEPKAADPLCTCGHPESEHVPATPTQKVCVGCIPCDTDTRVCPCLDFEDEDDGGQP